MRILQDVGFVHLHVHSSYSLLEGSMKIGDLADLAKADRQPALALTDTNNLFGALEFSEKLAGKGIQPIAGLQLSVSFEEPDPNARATALRCSDIVLLAADEEGYRNLMRLGSRSYFDVALGEPPRVAAAILREHAAGLIALTGGVSGPLDGALRDGGRADLAERRLAILQAAYGDRLYVEIQRHRREAERAVEAELIGLADRHGLPLVAANEPFFARTADFDSHDALLAIADGRLVSDDKRRRLTPEHRFKTRAEMAALFEDLPEALGASVEIAMRCAFRVLTRKPILPSFGTGRAGTPLDEAAELARQAEAGLEARLAAHGPAPGLDATTYRERLAFEVSVISRMAYAGYFLIVADFIRWAKEHDIPVGPGRGSGAGSLVAYALTITDLDPLRFGLLFERFLNPERVSMPDFDIDFCVDGRERVIRYVQERYGEAQVGQIITFGTLQARGVMRDVGRVLEMPYGQVDKLTKLVPQNPANPVTLQQAIDGEPKLQAAAADEPVVGRMLEIARKLEGLHRHASTHAAGVVIGDRPLQELVPLYRDPKTGMRVTQFNMKWVESAGLVKFDFLGLKTLTVLKRAVELIRARGIAIDLEALPLDDAKTYETIGRGETVGVFQVESAGMRKALCEMEADRFEDLIALVALYRPGPMANIPVYCARKLGRDPEPKERWYPHPKLEPILAETFGIIVYQEQVMQVAQLLAGYSLGDADLLRRAMGKKIRSEMDAQRVRFVSGAVERGLPRDSTDTIFDLLAKFADYGFNKSHAAAYALIAYQTAYLKANFPVEFLAASMSLDLDNTDKLGEFRREAQRLGIRVEPPSINRSGVVFEVETAVPESLASTRAPPPPHAEAVAAGNPRRTPNRGASFEAPLHGAPQDEEVGDSGSGLGVSHPGAIRYALAAIKGVGRSAVESLVEARGASPFRSLTDLAQRLNPRVINKRTLENLIAAGALDEIEEDRARATAAVDGVLALAQRSLETRSGGALDMFGGLSGTDVAVRVPLYQHWPAADRLRKEYEAVGFFLSGHPLDEYGELLRKLRVQTWVEFCRTARAGGGAVGRVAASVLDRQERRTRTGSKMGIVNLSDQTGHYEAIVFSEGLQTYRDLLEPGRDVLLVLQAGLEGDEVRARIQSAEPLEEALGKHQNDMRVFLRDERPIPSVQERLRGTRGGGRGEGEVSLILILDEGAREVEIRLPGRYPASPQIAGALRAVPGIVDVQLS